MGSVRVPWEKVELDWSYMQDYERLELEWAKWNKLDPAGMVACNSGTAALHLAFEALQLPQGSEVLCPDFTMIACPRAIAMAGLVPAFVDCDDHLLMDSELMNGNPKKNIRAALLVHVYGRRWDGWVSATFNPSLFLVEDLAEAHGIQPFPGTDAACWSFYKNKVVHGEEGGAVWFRMPAHARIARELRSLGFTPAHDFMHAPRGHNYRLANRLATPILHSIAMHDLCLSERRAVEGYYDRYCPMEWRMPARLVPWVYDLRIPGMSSGLQGEIVRVLNTEGIPARHAFKPMSQQPEFGKCKLFRRGEGNARRLSREVIYLPLSTGGSTAYRLDERACKDTLATVRRLCGW